MSAPARRRRGLAMIALAIVCGALAAARVHQQLANVERRVGPLVPVAVAGRDLRAGTRLGPRDLAVRRVPAAFAPRGALAAAGEAVGGRLAAPLAAGAYLTSGLLAGAVTQAGGPLRRGERALELAVSGGRALDAAAPGSRVDVVVSTEPRDGRSGRTFVALEGVELLALRPGAQPQDAQGSDAGAAHAATATAALRVTVKQAVFLSAAENFAREVRLLPRPQGDNGKEGRAAVAAGDL